MAAAAAAPAVQHVHHGKAPPEEVHLHAMHLPDESIWDARTAGPADGGKTPGRSRMGKQYTLATFSAKDLGEKVVLTEAELTRIKEVFEEYDYDQSGCIDRTEMADVLVELKWCIDSKNLDTFLEKILGANLSELDFESFILVYKAVVARQPTGVRKHVAAGGQGQGRINVHDLRLLESELRREFNRVDEDRSGYLSMDEMREVLKSSGLADADGDDFETAVLEHMQVIDENKDGKISFEEFTVYRNQIIDHNFQLAEAEERGEDDESGSQFMFAD